MVAHGLRVMEDGPPASSSRPSRSPRRSTVFVLIPTEVVPELVTIASRCVRIDVPALPATAVVERLVAEGVDPGRGRAPPRPRPRVTSSGPARWPPTSRLSLCAHQAWRDLPARLDGTGHRAAEVVAELRP